MRLKNKKNDWFNFNLKSKKSKQINSGVSSISTTVNKVIRKIALIFGIAFLPTMLFLLLLFTVIFTVWNFFSPDSFNTDVVNKIMSTVAVEITPTPTTGSGGFMASVLNAVSAILYFLYYSPTTYFFAWPWKYSKTKRIDDKNDPMDYIIKFVCFLPLVIGIITTLVFLGIDYFKLKAINIYQWKYLFIWLIPSFIVQGICHLILLKLGKNNKNKWLQDYYSFWNNQKSKRLSNQLASGRLMTDKESNNIFTTMLWNKNNVLVSNNENNNDIGFIINTKLKQNNSILEYKITNDIGHSLLIGSTRSGKTSLIINPQIQTFAKSSIQPTMIITDPKGELYKLHSANLKAQGYQIFKLDLRSENSDFWNPLEEVWHQWEVRNPNQKRDVDLEDVRNQAQDKIVKIIDMIISQSNDSIWSNGAKKILEGIILAMLEQAEWDNNITLDKFNFANIQYNLNSTTYENLNNYLDSIETKSKELNYLIRVIEVCGSTIRGAQKTTEGIIQQLTSSLIVFAQSKIKNITAKTTIKFDNNKPQAIFIIFPDEEKSTYDFISLFITENYSKLINELDKNNLAKYHCPIYYILDEFGNFPKIPVINQMISVASGRNIYFMLVVQSIAQIDEKYNITTRNNILSNITYKYYLMSGNSETRETIAREMGYTEITVQSTSESFAKQNNTFGGVALSQNKTKREVMSAEELATLPFGSAVIISQRNKPYLTTFDNFWNFKQFKPNESINNFKKTIISREQILYNFIQMQNKITTDEKLYLE